jgi:hypothetical protein
MAGTGFGTFSKDFPLDAGIFKTASVSVSGSTDANALAAILANDKFPDGDIQLGHISLTADTGNVTLNPASVGSVSFDLSASAQSGIGIYGKAADAISALNLPDAPAFQLPADITGDRYLLMNWGYSASLNGSASSPVGVLGTVSFGVDAAGDSVFAVLHRFDGAQGANNVMADTISSWRMPRNVAFANGDVNMKPGTWLLAEVDGSLAVQLATSLGWNVNFAKDLKVLGVTHDLSAKIDASLSANFGFSVAGKYIVIVGRETAAPVVRVQVSKQKSKGLNFGLNLSVGIQGADPQLPTNFDDFIETTFGVHGLQVLNDLQEWTDPSADLGQKIAGLADQDVLDLLKKTTGLDPVAEFDKAKQLVTNALNTWTSLPSKLSSMMWSYLGKLAGAAPAADFQTFLTDLANPTTAASALATALQKATFGDTPEGQFLESIADRGLLALANDLTPVTKAANQVLNILNGGLITRLQDFINQKLDLSQISAAVAAADPSQVSQWLQNRLANFLDKKIGTLVLDDIKKVQTAITALETNAAKFYSKAVQALTKHYSATFAATYQTTTSRTALIDVNFDLSVPDAAALFNEVVAQSKLDNLLTTDTAGVTLNQAKMTHEINRKGTVDLNMPWFDFSSTNVNDAMASLTVEEHGGRFLIYQVGATDSITIKNRASSQLSVMATLDVAAGQAPQLDSSGSIAYEMLQVKAGMRPSDLKARTQTFVQSYLPGLFGPDDSSPDKSSLDSFYADLDIALSAATKNASNDLGDMAVSMQVSLPISALSAWLQTRTTSMLNFDQMNVSRTLQAAWKNLLPAMYFQDVSQYGFNVTTAALLVWSSLPVSTSIDFNGDPSTIKFNTDKTVFWNWPDVDLRSAVANNSHTIATLGAKLGVIQGQLVEAGNSNAKFFDPSMAGKFVVEALDQVGSNLLTSLLSTESQLVGGATDALKQISAAMATVATAPSTAISTLAQFAADITNTFNSKVTSSYSVDQGMSNRVLGPMLLVEASRALGGPRSTPAGLMSLYALNPGHTADLSAFVGGTMPPKADVALTQTLVSLAAA